MTIQAGKLSMLALAGVLLSAGCKNETALSQSEALLEATPPLRDAGAVPVSQTAVLKFGLIHQSGLDIDISKVEVVNIEGEHFAFEGLEQAVLERNGELTLEVLYTPQEIGYHRAVVRISHGAKDSPLVLDVRGQGVLPDATIFPLGIDFGPVDVGDVEVRTITVANPSDLELTLTDATVSQDVFGLGTDLPLVVGPGTERKLDVLFSPADLEPATGTLVLKAGTVSLPTVALRGNDCEEGHPSAYDQDGDGYTSCAGDCDDSDPDVHPGAVESYDFRDEDCDGIVDEGTVGYDDDGDGYCEHGDNCSDPAFLPGDCNDGDADVNPAATEDLTNGIDDDCDGVVDNGTADGDSDGYAEEGGDCDDADSTVYPGAPELPDGKDNDCDGLVDEGTVVYDDDGDGYCEDPVACTDGSLPGDCDDTTTDLDGDLVPDGQTTYPGAPELPDWRDNDCDGEVDEGTIRADDDGDGYTEVGGDCDDTDPNVSPAHGNCP